MTTQRFRDLTLLRTNSGSFLIACDSSGAIGRKDADVVKTDPETVGYFLCRVPLMELLSQGVRPDAAVLTLSCEREPTGREIYRGAARALREAGCDPEMILNGSTEENIPTLQTGAGITLIGEAPADFAFSASPAGASVFVLGLPKVGDEVLADRGEIAPLGLPAELFGRAGVFEVLPVGSRGCFAEAQELAVTSGLRFQPEQPLPEWSGKSAGPSCAVLVSAKDAGALPKLSVALRLFGTLEEI